MCKLLILHAYEYGPKEESGLLMDVFDCINGFDYDTMSGRSFMDSPEDLAALKPAGLKQAKERLAQGIESLAPKCILILGETALESVSKFKYAKVKGTAITLTFGQHTCQAVVAPDLATVVKMPSRLEYFAKLVEKAHNLAHDIATSRTPTKVVMCDTYEKIRQLIEYIKQTGVACFDFETVKLDDKLGTFHPNFKATTLAISFQHGSSYVIPLEHKDSPLKAYVDEVMQLLAVEVFENSDIRKIAHNLDFDAHVLRHYGVRLAGRLDDTMLMHHLLDETERHGLKELLSDWLPEFRGYQEEVAGLDLETIPLNVLATYNGADTDGTFRLATQFEAMLMADEQLYLIYRNLTMAAFKALHKAESVGMLVDTVYLDEAIKELNGMVAQRVEAMNRHRVVARYMEARREEALEKAINEALEKAESFREKYGKETKHETNARKKAAQLRSGELTLPEDEFNYDSPKQVPDLLYFHPKGFKFDSLEKSAGKEVLELIKDDTGFLDQLLFYRSLTQILRTYLIGIKVRLDTRQRVHTSYKLSGTVSGRLSSSNPNLQNLPNVAKLSDPDVIKAVGMVKKALVAPAGHQLLQADYSQVELRVIADFAEEPNMLEAYLNDEDLHAKGAATLLGITLEQFYELDKAEQKKHRTRAKARNFGLIYGMSAKGFQSYAFRDFKLELTDKEAEKERNAFFKLYPGLIDCHNKYIAKAKQHGYVRTLFGRKRRTPYIHEQGYKGGEDERVAINSPIQGTAGELTIFAIALLKDRLPSGCLVVGTVHDSILFYLPVAKVDEAKKIIKETCENLPTQSYFKRKLKHLGLKVDMEIAPEGKSWKDLAEQ